MGVLAEIAKRVLRSAEWAFRVNDPRRAEQRTQPRREGFGILKCGECSVEAEFVLRVQCFEPFDELAPEHFFEDGDWQEKVLLRVDPSRAVQSQAAGGNDTMNMRMVLELLVPCVKNAEEPDLGAEVLRIAADFQ